jgi:hypothetical protein
VLKVGILILGAAWFCAACFGLKVVWTYDNTPGRASAPPRDWPSRSRIAPPSGASTLVFFAHPRCPCTRASVESLAEIASRCGKRLSIIAILYRPIGSAPDWDHADIRRSIEAIPGARVQSDEGGREAKLFHAATSGAAILFDGSGRLLFSGGITGARGHSMSGGGRDTVIQWALSGSAARGSAPVYGCSLFAREGAATEKRS